jgi:hypothetical protein
LGISEGGGFSGLRQSVTRRTAKANGMPELGVPLWAYDKTTGPTGVAEPSPLATASVADRMLHCHPR